MPTLDLAMPTALFLVALVGLLLSKRVENRLTETVEQKEFKTRDIFMLVAFILIVVSVIAYTAIVNPGGVFENALLVFFMGSYTTLLFTFSYIFSNTTKTRVQLLSAGFGVAAIIAGVISLLDPLGDAYTIYRIAAFFILATFCFSVVIFEQKKSTPEKSRWYMAAQPPALFLLLFIFFNVIYSGTTQVWNPVLLDVFGFTFAILIIIYLSSLFTWKTVCLFAGLLTIMDIILVFTGPMVTAANTFTDLGLPVLVYLPNFPILLKETGGILFRGLGLGDYFFAGILAVQTYNKFGKKTAVMAVVAMAVSFGIWEAFLPEITKFFDIGGFPATVCIITGWIPIVAYKLLATRRKPVPSSSATPPPAEVPKEPRLPMQQ
ncbi:MAG: hypothetical protein LBH74_10045 [Nitrososphaerota archaeon]|uniref:hypothetical protein n=1 Tax=Candidatus Bathycorpusculum sp. TaxID=2994959 RepID=UPI002837C87B|nr:hypothetical protein [Candidatus Termitimicrobium sp.]MCL2431607.1 hypothetical protein [Candidatus Termitimicrobium sp.]MDR0493955.1 hypothetical protein [Nitrososphaerota archaeon]